MQQTLEILENKRNMEHLAEAFARDRLSHAYIINGPAGSGKKTFARYFAAALLCDKMHGGGDDGQTDLFSMFAIEKPREARLSDGPCGSCPACAKSLSGNHPDIIFLKRGKENVIQVGEVRQQIIDDVSIKPYYGPYKIYIIEDAHLMNENAQNAILKTIEEPPEYAIIFLLSENADSFLDTIRSRCIRLDMEKLSRETILDYLKNRLGVPEAQAERAAAFARGNLGEAIDISESKESSETILKTVDVLKKIKTMNAADIFDEAAAFGKEDPLQILKVSRMWFRDILVLKAEEGNLHSELYFPAEKDVLKRFADNVPYEKLENIMKAIDTAKARLEANVKAEAVLEILFLAIRRNIKW